MSRAGVQCARHQIQGDEEAGGGGTARLCRQTQAGDDLGFTPSEASHRRERSLWSLRSDGQASSESRLNVFILPALLGTDGQGTAFASRWAQCHTL